MCRSSRNCFPWQSSRKTQLFHSRCVVAVGQLPVENNFSIKHTSLKMSNLLALKSPRL